MLRVSYNYAVQIRRQSSLTDDSFNEGKLFIIHTSTSCLKKTVTQALYTKRLRVGWLRITLLLERK